VHHDIDPRFRAAVSRLAFDEVTKLVERCRTRRQRRVQRLEQLHDVLDDAGEQRLLGVEVVVERRDIEADRGRDVAGAQPLEPLVGFVMARLLGRVRAKMLRVGLPAVLADLDGDGPPG